MALEPLEFIPNSAILPVPLVKMNFKKEINTELKRFGNKIRQLRTEKGLTQLDLSARCIIDRSDISRIENGEMNIKFSSVVQLAIALEVDILDLFTASK